MRLGELVLQRVSFLGQTVHYRASRIAESHHLGALVKGLTHSVINGLAEDFILKRAVHLHYLRIAS